MRGKTREIATCDVGRERRRLPLHVCLILIFAFSSRTRSGAEGRQLFGGPRGGDVLVGALRGCAAQPVETGCHVLLDALSAEKRDAVRVLGRRVGVRRGPLVEARRERLRGSHGV